MDNRRSLDFTVSSRFLSAIRRQSSPSIAALNSISSYSAIHVEGKISRPHAQGAVASPGTEHTPPALSPDAPSSFSYPFHLLSFFSSPGKNGKREEIEWKQKAKGHARPKCSSIPPGEKDLAPCLVQSKYRYKGTTPIHELLDGRKSSFNPRTRNLGVPRLTISE
jgi:hypothetical protein